ncbi:hypothetical protein GCM10010412_071050 [Nonomuraea recticatena]|uniref:Uncharacterized protein n=1 Tax=Nonomuraea recticatena TaxID=46178 RepID=A0ABP6F7H0_9ACTN
MNRKYMAANTSQPISAIRTGTLDQRSAFFAVGDDTRESVRGEDHPSYGFADTFTLRAQFHHMFAPSSSTGRSSVPRS